jgi:hypothetical protein
MGSCSSRAVAPLGAGDKPTVTTRSSVEVPAEDDSAPPPVVGSQRQINEFVRKLWLDSQRDALVALLADPQVCCDDAAGAVCARHCGGTNSHAGFRPLQGKAAFRAYLTQEQAVENLDFLDEVSTLTDVGDSTLLLNEAKEVYVKCVLPQKCTLEHPIAAFRRVRASCGQLKLVCRD